MHRNLRNLWVLPICLLALSYSILAAAPSVVLKISPAEALAKLEKGNSRYVSGQSLHINQSRIRRQETSLKGQHPFATILSCSDSRVPPEILFDLGIGDLFVIRVAGNVADTDEIGTAEYGVDHLGTTLVVVLGHTKCGAVTAVATGAELHGSLPGLVDNILPAVKRVKELNPTLQGDSLVPEAIKANVWQSVEDILKRSEMIRRKVSCGGTAILGALYDLDSGKVQWMGTHPEEKKLLAEPAAGGTKPDESKPTAGH